MFAFVYVIINICTFHVQTLKKRIIYIKMLIFFSISGQGYIRITKKEHSYYDVDDL